MSKPYSFILTWLPHLAAMAVILMCLRLAAWQYDRADEKRDLLQSWEQAEAVGLSESVPAEIRYAQVRATGRFNASRQVLLDNQIRNGRAGVHVFTPFQPKGQITAWLVNRGWHALESRQGPLPRIEAPTQELTIRGRLVDPPRVGLQLGEARELDSAPWPQLVTYLEPKRVEAAVGNDLAERVILLEPAHPAHLTGDPWQPVNFGPDRHRAYAWQWLTMAAVVFLIWVGLTWRKLRKS